MERYRMLPHTADAKFEAFGENLEEAYGNAALALASLMWDWAAVEPRLELAVKVTGRDKEQLLVRFLGEVLFLAETRGFLLAGVSGLQLRREGEGWTLGASLRGDAASGRYEVHGSVKAVTYNEMVIEAGDGCRVQVVVDM